MEKKKSNPYLEKPKIPIVVLENNKRLQEMARNLKLRKRRKEKENNIICKVNVRNEKQENEEHNKIQIQINNSSQVMEKHSFENDILNENQHYDYAENSIFIKPEINLLDTSSQINSSQSDLSTPELYNKYEVYHCQTDQIQQIHMDSQLSDNSLNFSAPVIFNRDLENVSSLDTSYDNISSEEQYNMCDQGSIFNCIPGSIDSTSQFNPNISLINSREFSDNCSPYSQVTLNPFFQNTRLPSQNFGIRTEELWSNPVFDAAQEIAKLQTAIFHLNAQVSFLKNLVNQSYLKHFTENL
jgi:hypothetical protein